MRLLRRYPHSCLWSLSHQGLQFQGGRPSGHLGGGFFPLDFLKAFQTLLRANKKRQDDSSGFEPIKYLPIWNGRREGIVLASDISGCRSSSDPLQFSDPSVIQPRHRIPELRTTKHALPDPATRPHSTSYTGRAGSQITSSPATMTRPRGGSAASEDSAGTLDQVRLGLPPIPTSTAILSLRRSSGACTTILPRSSFSGPAAAESEFSPPSPSSPLPFRPARRPCSRGIYPAGTEQPRAQRRRDAQRRATCQGGMLTERQILPAASLRQERVARALVADHRR